MTQISAELPTHPLVVATESEPLKVDVSPATILHCENFFFSEQGGFPGCAPILLHPIEPGIFLLIPNFHFHVYMAVYMLLSLDKERKWPILALG